MVIDGAGSLAGVTRHDYLPFGEELGVGVGGRTTQQGYAGDSLRHRWTTYERDSETGLDYAQARYYSNAQGRFNSPDTFGGSMWNPQTLNLYAYVQNNPLNYNDPTGHLASPTSLDATRCALFGGCDGPLAQGGGKLPVKPPAPEGYIWTKAGELARVGEEAAERGVLNESINVVAKAGKKGLFRKVLGRVAAFGVGLAGGVASAFVGEMVSPSRTAGGGDADLGPASMPWMTPGVRATFLGDRYNPHRLERDTTFNRYFDEGYMISGKSVGYLSEDLYSTSAEARAALALSPAVTLNHASRIVAVVVPAGTVVARGRAAPMGPGYSGGGSQVVIGNPRDPNLRWGKSVPLP